jgi:hypothetical protein
MQRRVTVLNDKLAQAQHQLQLATNSRADSVVAVSRDPASEKAHAALDAAIAAVPVWQQKVEALESALHDAQRLDRIDEIEAKRAGLIAARNRAVKLAAARKPLAVELQANVDALAATLKKFDAANDATLLAIYEATAGAAPRDPNESGIFGQRATLASNAVTANLKHAFVLALHDAGFGEIGIDLSGLIEYQNHNHLAHGDRSGLAAAVEKSATTIAQTLDFLHKSVGVIEADPVVESEPMIPAPEEVELPDGSFYSCDATETVWTAPK